MGKMRPYKKALVSPAQHRLNERARKQKRKTSRKSRVQNKA